MSNPTALDRLITTVSARIPASVTPSTRIEIHPSEWLMLVDEVQQRPVPLCTTHTTEHQVRNILPCPWCVIDEMKLNRDDALKLKDKKP